jgi:RIO kinase 1
MAKRTKHGREQEEAAWRSTEVDVIYRLHAGGVRVPKPYHFIDGVLVMELIADADGNPAPRLGDLSFEPEAATAIYERLIREVIRMLCTGIVHGDLSDFNVLLGADGPVIIDFPQSVDTAHNNNARQLLLRDVDNMYRFLKRFVPNAHRLPYAEEMWDLHQNNALTPDTQLAGRYRAAQRHANIGNVLNIIHDANYDERKRRDALGLRGGPSPRELAANRARPQDVRGPVAQQRPFPRQSVAHKVAPHAGPAGAPKASQRRADPRIDGQHPAPQVAQMGKSRQHAPPPNRSFRSTQHSSGRSGQSSVEVIVLRRPAR